ncbi:serine/threonine protein kinase [Edhazardia aedis USNM 41457]|uniref:Serine/threonine protein kinase n=1 Tax=Edhazardia aedis (strain USNM 41457) TaxID=1003232 RepID=J9DMB9_EDHAE|nr:serine/threonine protein kinase [Edhazardia aedis USNM 41457]|eukprot:EJW02517.1 serine/threonine protein kinase [Edhazardia aedis USNM 41457]
MNGSYEELKLVSTKASEEIDDEDLKQAGNYILKTQLGDGRYAIVKECFHMNNEDKRLAIKILNKNLINMVNPNFIKRELLAYQTIKDIEGIPKFYEYFEDNLRAYFVIDYVNGYHIQRELIERQILNNGPVFTNKEKKEIIIKTIDILKKLHSQNVFHGDLKLENILYDSSSGNVFLVDFGCSYCRKDGIIYKKELSGTPGYGPPESLLKSKEPLRLENLDVWGICVVFYYIFTTKYPFGNDGVFPTFDRVQKCKYNRENVDEKILNICDRVFVKNADERVTLEGFLKLVKEFPVD